MLFDGTPEQLDVIREIAENLNDPVFLVDKAFNVWYSNAAFDAGVGVRAKSRRYAEMPCHKLLNLEICAERCVMRQVTSEQRSVRLAEIVGDTIGGERKHFNVSAIPVINKSGAAFGALIILRDMTSEAEIQRKYKQLVQRNAAVSLSGRLDRGNLPDIVQLISFLQKTGVLTITAGAHKGDLVFEKGRIAGVICGAATNAKALGRMVGWTDGHFSFTPQDAIELTDPFEGNPDFLLMDALRELDETANKQATLPPPGARLRALAEDPGDLEPLHGALLAAAERGPTVAEAIDQVPQTDYQAAVALTELRARGLVSWE